MPHPKQGYKNANGDKIPGVTTICNRFMDSSALIGWAFKQGQAKERGEIKSLYDKRDEAATAGSIAHRIVELHINGDTTPDLTAGSEYNPAPEVMHQAKKAYINYCKWEGMSNLEVIEQECQLVSEQYQFGGCLDALGKINGKTAIIDWKTSKGVYSNMLVQLGGYKLLVEENWPPGKLDGGFHLIKFSKETGDFAHHHWDELDDAVEQFTLFRKAYELDKKLEKRV